MAPPRRTSSMAYEADRAILSLAGVRAVVQTKITVAATSANGYTMTSTESRRLVCLHLGTGAGDIRFKVGATAAATDMPLLPQHYVVIDLGVGEAVSFYNTTGSGIDIYLTEVA